MVNFVLNENVQMKKQIIYAFYYLTKNYLDFSKKNKDASVIISKVPMNNCINIFYGNVSDSGRGIYIPCFSGKENVKFNKYKDKTFISFENSIECPYHVDGDSVIFNFDILYSSFYILSCKEEYDINTRDSMNRFLGSFSLRNEHINVPFFDGNSSMMLEALQILDKGIISKQNKFEIMLTHDVDSVNSRNKYVFLHNIKELVKGKNSSLGDRLNCVVSDILYNRHLQIENYIEIEKSKGAKSEFYFIEGKKHRLGKRYELKDISNQIDMLKNSDNFIIGMHTNFFSYDNTESMKQEIEAIENFTGTEVASCRNHYLRFSIPETWEALSKAGIFCDTTLGYSDVNGFRGGTTRSFIPFNINSNNIVNIYEVPLIVMDGIVMEKDISFDDKWTEIKDRIDMASKYGGTASLLWHQRVILDEEYKNMYIKILDYINSIGGKFILSSDLTPRFDEDMKNIYDLFENI